MHVNAENMASQEFSLEPCSLSMKMSIMLLLRQRYFQGSLFAFCNPFCLPSRKDRRKQIRRWGEKRWVDFLFLFPILSFVSEFFWRKLSIGRWMIRLIRERKQTFFLGVSFICPGTVVRTCKKYSQPARKLLRPHCPTNDRPRYFFLLPASFHSLKKVCRKVFFSIFSFCESILNSRAIVSLEARKVASILFPFSTLDALSLNRKIRWVYAT